MRERRAAVEIFSNLREQRKCPSRYVFAMRDGKWRNEMQLDIPGRPAVSQLHEIEQMP
jgi:hypothetical protein